MRGKIFTLVMFAGFILSLIGCGNSGKIESNVASTNGKIVENTSITTSTEEDVIDITVMTAEEIIIRFFDAGLPVLHVVSYTEENDPNSLLGRPNQYASKINFADSRIEQDDMENDPIGGSIEVFASASDAKARRDYVEAITSSISTFAEYIYLYENVLLRIHHDLTPSQASVYESAFTSLVEGNAIEYTGNE